MSEFVIRENQLSHLTELLGYERAFQNLHPKAFTQQTPGVLSKTGRDSDFRQFLLFLEH